MLGALDAAGIDVIAGAAARAAVEGALRLHDGRVVGADVAVRSRSSMVPASRACRTTLTASWRSTSTASSAAATDVFAAGDATAFPIKHGSLAAAQADAIAETIAARAGALADPAPLRPVLQGMLLTGADPLYIRAELGVSATVTTEPLWSPPAKIVGRYLTPFLAAV